MKLYPDMNWNMDTQYLTVITIFWYVLFIITFQSIVGIMTIIAATTTAFWNIYKYVMDRRDRRRAANKDQESHKVINMNTDKTQEHE